LLASEFGSPPEQLRIELGRMKLGRLAFDRAWPIALRNIVWGCGPERAAWYAVLVGSRAAFEAAYADEAPASPAAALAGLDADFPDPHLDGYRHQTRGRVGARTPATRDGPAPVGVGAA